MRCTVNIAEMDSYSHRHHMFERRAVPRSRAPPVRWVKEWVPQDLLANGGKCMVLKWVTESTLKALRERKEPEASEAEPEQTSEVLFLCNYEGCGKTFIDATLLKKHSHIHGERQYICHYEGCGKKFLDSSKLKRHFLIHTGERDYVCPHAGCGKAFSLDFNLRSHMKTHSQENYHICPYPECGKRYAHEYKLRNHLLSQHEKNMSDLPKYTVPMPEPRQVKTPKASAVSYASHSPDRPYVCPYDGCEKAYIHEYKLNLHLRREHPAHFKDDTPKNGKSNGADETSDHDAFHSKRVSEKTKKQSSRSKPSQNLPPAKSARRGSNSNPSPASTKISKKAWLRKEVYGDNDDSEETEEEEEREETWRYRPTEEDDEETEDED